MRVGRLWVGGAGLAVPALLLSALGGGCAVNPVTGQSELMLVSEESEIALGQEAFPQLIWQDGGPLRVDPATRDYLAGIVARLHQVSHRPGLPVDFTLEAASVPNAWAIPGHTAMNRGLLQSLEDEAEFAFVMGHEVGHVAARHSARRQTYALLGSGLVGAAGLAAGLPSDAGARALAQLAVGVGALGTQLALLRYDRGQELEADRLGVLYMSRAGYDPTRAVAAHQALQRAVDRYLGALGKTREEPGWVSDLLSTHPRHSVRVEEIQQLVRTLPATDAGREGDGRFAERWRHGTAGVRALAPAYGHYDRARLALGQGDLGGAERAVTEAMRLADQAQFVTLLAAIRLEQGRPEEARQGYRRALQLYPGYQPALHGLGVIEIAQGHDAAAVPLLQQSLVLRPGYGPSQYALGMAYARSGQTREAIALLSPVAEANPGHPDVHGALAQLHERAGEPAAAYAAWQAQARAAPNSVLGRQAQERMRALAATVVEPYRSASARVRVERPASWEVDRDGSGPLGGELVLKRDRETQLRVATRDFGRSQDLRTRLDEALRVRLGDRRVTVVREHPAYWVGGLSGPARVVRYGDVEHLFVTVGRGGRVWYLDLRASRDTWRDRDRRREIERVLESVDF